RRFVVVDNGKVEKSAGSIGNTGSNSRGSCSPQVQTSNLGSKQNQLPKKYRNFCRVLTASLPLGLSRLVHWLRLIPAKLAPSHTGPNSFSGICQTKWVITPGSLAGFDSAGSVITPLAGFGDGRPHRP